MSGSSANILLVDPDRSMHKLLRRGLYGSGFALMAAGSGRQALGLLRMAPNLALIELELPDMSGLELLDRLRERAEELPVIAISRKGDARTKVQMLDFGASDYLQKPFDVDELAARIRVALRRRFEYPVGRPIYRCGLLKVDLTNRSVTFAGAEVRLSPKEYDLLRLFVVHAGKVLTHEFLMGELWQEKVDTQFLRVYIRQIRRKIEDDPAHPKYLLTQTGVGYRLCAATAELDPDEAPSNSEAGQLS